MKVDMSPDAVRQRLRALEQLWVLSVKLMHSKKIASVKDLPAQTADQRSDDQKTNRKYGLPDHAGC